MATARTAAAMKRGNPRKAHQHNTEEPGGAAQQSEEVVGTPVRLSPIRMITASVPIVGETPVIPHRWSEKSKRMMFEKQSGQTARPKRDPKVKEDEAEAATYRLFDGRPGIPATAFKAAIVDGVRLFDGITMTAAKQWVRVGGEPGADRLDVLVALEGPSEIREDTPRNSGGTADLRYRRYYWPWSAVIEITFPERYIDVGSIIRLVNAGGLGGVGDWRPSAPKSKTGTYGCFLVDETKNIELCQTAR